MADVSFNASIPQIQDLPGSKTVVNQQNYSAPVVAGSAQRNEDKFVNAGTEPTEADKVSAQKQAESHKKQLDDIEKMKRANTTQTETEVNPNNGQKLTIVTKYDSMGNEEKMTVYREDGSISCVSNFKDGKQTGMDAYYPDGTLAAKTEFVDGKISKEVNYSPDGNVKTTRTCEYYPNGNLKSDVCEGGLIPYSMTYYENGQLKQEKRFDTISEYNEKGQKIKETNTSENPEFAGISTYEYNEDGKEISSHRYTLDGKILIERTESEYTDTKEIYKTYNQDGNLEFTIEYEKMPDGSTIQRENGKFTSRIKLVEGDNYETTGEKETYNMNESGETIAVMKPVIEKDETGQEYTTFEYYDGKGNKITEDKYQEIME